MMKLLRTVPAAAFLILLAIILGLAGCTEENPVNPDPPKSIDGAKAIVGLAYTHVSDDNGTKPRAGTTVALFFEPNGTARIDVTDGKEAIAYKGTWSLAAGTMKLKFDHPDYRHDISFALDTSLAEITLPFRNFSDGAGSSKWARNYVGIETRIRMLFNASMTSDNLTAAQAVDRVVEYVRSTMQLGSLGKPSVDKRVIEDVESMPNGVILRYKDAPTTVSILLFDRATHVNGPEITWSPLASDPRIHLPVNEPSDGSADPKLKRALLIMPFSSERTVEWLTSTGFGSDVRVGATSATHGFDELAKPDELRSKLQERGYEVELLKDGQASVVNIIQGFMAGGPGRAPGFTMLYSHSHPWGIAIGTTLGIKDYDYQSRWEMAQDEIIEAGYGDLLTYKSEDPAWAKVPAVMVMGIGSLRESMKNVYYVAVTPVFFEWLRKKKGADFSTSMVMLMSCMTDSKPYFRDAIKAGSHFGFSVIVDAGIAGATVRYMVHQITRPTFTAEEAYYNMIRIANTRKAIYPEDNLFGSTNWPKFNQQRDEISLILGGHFLDETTKTMVPYSERGWLKQAAPGDVWWLLFGGRWGQNAQAGVDGMQVCWDNFWKDGRTAGLKDPNCNAKDPGHAPSPESVAYASYLLNGTPIVAQPALKARRWTLADG